MNNSFSVIRSKFKRSRKQSHVVSAAVALKRPMVLRFATQEQILFAKRLGMILRSGTPIMEGLHMLSDHTSSRSASFIYGSIISDVSNGLPLSHGMQKFDRVFGDFGINIVRVGETSGNLHQNLDYLAEELKKKQILRRKVIGALIYPAVIIFATFGITLLLTVYIFPKITPIFQSVKAELPLSTKILIAISSFLGHWGTALAIGFLVFIVSFFIALRSARFHLWMDTVLLRLPVLGKLSQYYNLANICRTLSMLLKSDVRIAEAIDLVAAGTRNLVYRRELFLARERIVKGQKISTQFKAHPRLFPPMLSQMVTVGESTGNLSSTLSYLSDMYEEEIGELTKNLTTMLEPILMIVMGLIVGFIAVSIITPIYSITQNITPHQ